MAHCSLPVDIPFSPPSYEEAIQTAAPEIPTSETGSNDEPPPSYTEATKDDVFSSSCQPSELSEPPSTSDLAGLIIASIVSSHRSQQGRQPILIHQGSSSRSQIGPSNRDPERAPAPTVTAQSRSRHKMKWCLIGTGLGVFLVAGLITASVLRQRPNKPSNDNSDSSYMNSFTIPTFDPSLWNSFTVPTLDPSLWNSFTVPKLDPSLWNRRTTPTPFDIDRLKSIAEESRRRAELIDRLKGLHSTPKPFNFLPNFYGKDSDFASKPSVFGIAKNHNFDDFMKKIQDERSFDKTSPKGM